MEHAGAQVVAVAVTSDNTGKSRLCTPEPACRQLEQRRANA